MEKKIFEKNGNKVELELIPRNEKGKEKFFVVVDGCEVPTSKNGLTKEFMKEFVRSKDKSVRLWYLNTCKNLTTTKRSEALKRNVSSLDIEALRNAFVKKFDFEFIYKKESQYKTYIDELEAELFGEDTEENFEENLKESA